MSQFGPRCRNVNQIRKNPNIICEIKVNGDNRKLYGDRDYHSDGWSEDLVPRNIRDNRKRDIKEEYYSDTDDFEEIISRNMRMNRKREGYGITRRVIIGQWRDT